MILDMTCGAKEMWINKKPRDVVFLDHFKGVREYPALDRKWKVSPDVLADWGFLPFKDESFSMVLFDPPHEIGNGTGLFQTLYEQLPPGKWQKILWLALKEGARVLKVGGFFILKWAETSRNLNRILSLYPQCLYKLFGHTTMSNKTCWVCSKKVEL